MKSNWIKSIGLSMIIIQIVLAIRENDKPLNEDIVNKDLAISNIDNKKDESDDKEDANNIKTIEVVATGDILIHKEILDTQYNEITGEYDFNNN